VDKNFHTAMLLPGDALLYFSGDLFDWIVAVKTWTCVAHVEIYAGQGLSVASRNGRGVNRYPLRQAGICCVRRPVGHLDREAAREWFERKARGQRYDWLGLLCFTLAVRRGSRRRMFCSEFATRWYRAAGHVPFDSEWDADKVPPSFFLASPNFETVWKHVKLLKGD